MCNKAMDDDQERQILTDDSDITENPNLESYSRFNNVVLRCLWSFKWILLFIVIAVVAMGVFWGICMSPSSMYSSFNLKVMSLNVWGLPVGTNGCRDKDTRIQAISKMIQNEHFDIFIVQGLWMEPDHTTLNQVSEVNGLFMTGFRDLAMGTCDGNILRTYCSGLAVISRHPYQSVTFESFEYKGQFPKDNEWSLGKGIGRVSYLINNVTVDVFLSQTHDTSLWYQNEQIGEILKGIKKSSAEVILLGADLNVPPESKPYQRLINYKNSAKEAYPDSWTNVAEFATVGHAGNSYEAPAEILDYLFYTTSYEDVQLEGFQLKDFKNSTDGSISNHQCLIADFKIISNIMN